MIKPIAAKPSLYAHYFYTLKEIALKYGYNLVLHGSMNRDLDLVAIPWQAELGPHGEMIDEMAKLLGGEIEKNMPVRDEEGTLIDIREYSVTHHGRMQYIIDLNRGGYTADLKYIEDPQYYLDISVMPTEQTAIIKTEQPQERLDELEYKLTSMQVEHQQLTAENERLREVYAELANRYSIVASKNIYHQRAINKRWSKQAGINLTHD